MKLNSNDVEIIKEVFLNPKLSNRELSKKLGFSKETISKKINKYLIKGLIKNYSIGINYSKLEFIEYNLFFRLKKLDDISYGKIIDYLVKNDNTTWIGKSFGKYDLKVAVIFIKQEELNLFIKDVFLLLGNFIELIDSLLVIDKFKVSKEIFINNLLNSNFKILNNKSNEIKTQLINNYNKFKLNNLDKSLIYDLSFNSKISLVNLALKNNQTAEGIKYRIKNLEKKEIITNYSVVIDGNKLNKIWCLILLNISEQDLDKFKNYLKKDHNLSSYIQTIGVWNLNITFFAKDIESLYYGLNNFRTKFSKEIRNFEYMIFFDFYKFPNAPKCILN